MESESIVFANGGIRLAGSLYKPLTAPPFRVVIAVHPALQGEQVDPFYDHLKVNLPRRGFAFLVFDRRGSGASEGDFVTASFNDLAGDVMAAIGYLRSRPDIRSDKIGLHGTSQGAWIAPIAASLDSNVSFLVEVSACGVTPAEQMDYAAAFHLQQDGFDPEVIRQALSLRHQVNEYFRGNLHRAEVAAHLAESEGAPWFENSYLPASAELPSDILSAKWYYQMDYEPLAVWENIDVPTLFLFGDVDEWVPVEQSKLNYTNATVHMQDVTLVQLKGVDHFMQNLAGPPQGRVSSEYLDILLAWLEKVV